MTKEHKVKDIIGEKFISNEGYEFYVIEYKNSCNMTIKFADKYGAEKHTKLSNCRNGSVKNPYHPSVYGVGCLGEGNFKTGTREYDLWKHMLQRCYSEKYQQRKPTYVGTTVCDRWLIYANFLEDLPLIEGYELWLNNPNQGIALDKDTKQQGVEDKVYSLETVRFITRYENTMEVHRREK